MSSQDLDQKVQELQSLEQNLQSFLMQKQTFQVELNEVQNALTELKNSDDEVYRILGGIMIKAEKNSLTKELDEKKRLIELRISSIEKQEKIIDGKAEKLRKDINDLMSKNKK